MNLIFRPSTLKLLLTQIMKVHYYVIFYILATMAAPGLNHIQS